MSWYDDIDPNHPPSAISRIITEHPGVAVIFDLAANRGTRCRIGKIRGACFNPMWEGVSIPDVDAVGRSLALAVQEMQRELRLFKLQGDGKKEVSSDGANTNS